MKKFVLCLSIATAIIQILSSSNLRAQTLMPQLTDQDPPPDPIFLQQGPPVIPHTTKSDSRSGDRLRGMRPLLP